MKETKIIIPLMLFYLWMIIIVLEDRLFFNELYINIVNIICIIVSTVSLMYLWKQYRANKDMKYAGVCKINFIFIPLINIVVLIKMFLF